MVMEKGDTGSLENAESVKMLIATQKTLPSHLQGEITSERKTMRLCKELRDKCVLVENLS